MNCTKFIQKSIVIPNEKRHRSDAFHCHRFPRKTATFIILFILGNMSILTRKKCG